MRPILALATALTLAAAGCTDSGPITLPDLVMTTDYPPGPYGYKVGDVVPDIAAMGYNLSATQTDSTKLTFGAVRLSAWRTAHPECRCIIINITAAANDPMDPAIYLNQQKALIAAVAADPGVCVFESAALIHPASPNPPDATRADLDAWTQSVKQPWPVVLATNEVNSLLNTAGMYPLDTVVRRDTMKIQAHVVGFKADMPLAAELAACPK